MIKSRVIDVVHLVLFLLLSQFSSAYAAATSPRPVVRASVSDVNLGADAGSDTMLPDLFTGTFSYRIPIEVPAGRNNVQPGLALTYRSNNGNGWIGMGWELEVGAIQRSTKGGVNYSGSNFQMKVSGATLDLVSFNGEYRAKIEKNFNRIRQLPAFDGYTYWEVTNKVGVRFLFGQASASRQDDPSAGSRIFKWCLDEVIEPNGNYMTFSYVKDQRQIYLDQINYTAYSGTGASLPPTNYVKFYRAGNRTDAPTMYNLVPSNI